MKAVLICWIGACMSLAAGTLTFEETTKRVDAGVDAKLVTVDFVFRNESAETVTIVRYDAACTCINAGIKDGRLVYPPGEGGVIRANFDMSQVSGTTDKSLAVWLQGDPDDKPSISLTARVTIPVLVEVEPKTLFWEVGGPAEPKVVSLRMKHDKPIHVTSVAGADARFKQTLRTIEKGKSYEIVVTPAGTGEVGMGVIHIETDCASARFRTQRVFTVVRRSVSKPADSSAKP
ncbi:MAG: DUF1573 domain-containing protein [Verrucomicrobia bacterium]|nr:MAG: DUF1573 domain-containing protein [Verrucomicrobiota bacterium]TAE89377.1 MAG: DUF1573 domain-containing protein [Verrucomicrobiota bacterium]TAF27747.1 MAG: DUF1573 domain-containing protein [Verrucomicrobiota bacterium]TAF42596.1 MAG: DUF1573 domain-containing protein [Verrucomicrobiota bacterium]